MADTTNPFGGAAGSTGGMFGGGMWGSPQPSPYGGYGGMQSPYGGGYGGFGGGMPYGGGYGMQSPYGGSYGGYGGMQSPYGGYGMQQPYGGYGAPQQGYGGYSPYGMPSQYGPQPSYGMPQQQTMMAAPQVATQEGAGAAGGDVVAATSDAVTPANVLDDAAQNLNIGGSTTQTNRFDPWGPQQEQLRRYLTGTTGRIVDGRAEEVSAEGMPTTGAMGELYKQQQAGALGFDPQSEAALQRMQQMSTGANPMFDASMGAATGIASGQYGIGGEQDYRNFGSAANGLNPGWFESMIGNTNIQTGDYRNMYNTNPTTGGEYGEIYGGSKGQGSLGGGMFGQIAQGNLVNGNPYREKAIQDAMNQTSDQVKATMSSRGRYGSDAYGDAMGTALGQVATQARMAGYDTDTANMMAAAQARSGENLARQGIGLQAAGGIQGGQLANYQNRLAALQGLTGAQGADINARLTAARGSFDVNAQNRANQLAGLQGITGIQGQNLQNRMAAAGMAPAMQGLRYDDINRQLQAGATREAMAQQQKNYGWDTLRQFQGLVGGVPGSAGTSKGTESQPWWQTAAGLGALAGGIWGSGTPTA